MSNKIFIFFIFKIPQSTINHSERDLSNSPSRRLSPPQSGISQFCRKISIDKYKTIFVPTFLVRVYTYLHPNDLSGSCKSLCSDVCNHQGCTPDFQISQDSLTCSCILNSVSSCGNNTQCVVSNSTIEECKCLEGYEGDPNVGCFQTSSVIVSGPTSDLQVVKCNSTTVEIQGPLANLTLPGTFFIYTDDFGCKFCSPLFRKITSVKNQTNGAILLTTTFATFGEILGNDIVVPEIQNALLEPAAGCAHSGNSSRRMLFTKTHEDYQVPVEGLHHRQLQAFPDQCGAWQSKNPDGRCTYTNCFVGPDGNPNDCFICGTSCNNGCGAAGSSLNTDGNFIFFDFGPACCIHDHCYSSTFSKATCDDEFYKDMISTCPVLIPLVLVSSLPLKACATLATAFYLAVVFGGGDAAIAAKQAQANYEKTNPVCIAKCPTTQQSGGQGTTTLAIDLLRKSGSFPISYQMYTIPDQFYITYEGTRIFDTGGLVSGGSSTNVRFNGTSTIIEATIFAPNSGTAWDVFVGCPVSV